VSVHVTKFDEEEGKKILPSIATIPALSALPGSLDGREKSALPIAV